MAAMAMLDLLRKNPNFGSQAFASRTLFSAKFVGGASTFAIAAPFAARAALFGNCGAQIAYCDAGDSSVAEDYVSSLWSAPENVFLDDAWDYSEKRYDLQLKPIFSAFHWRTLALTTLRSFLLFYLPLLDQQTPLEDEDDDFLQENPVEKRVDLVVPFKKSVKQILRETTVITTRRVLERVAVHYVSQRMAWKLLKDARKSATRKAGRCLPTPTFVLCVSRTTFRAHFLGVLASWMVQVGIDVYRFFKSITKSKEDKDDQVNNEDQVLLLGKKVYGSTLQCCSSIVFASIGAGIGAACMHPSTGQWIGCSVGDLAGPFLVGFCLEKLNWEM